MVPKVVHTEGAVVSQKLSNRVYARGQCLLCVDFDIKAKTLTFTTMFGRLAQFAHMKLCDDIGKYRLGVTFSHALAKCTMVRCQACFDDQGVLNATSPITAASEQQDDVSQLNGILTHTIEKYEQVSQTISVLKVDGDDAAKLSAALKTLNEKKEIFDQLFGQNVDILDEKIKRVQQDWNDKYQEWKLNDIIDWIGKLEDGRFIQYCGVLRSGFCSDNVKSKDLPLLSTSELKNFGVRVFRDRLDLTKHFQSLKDKVDHQDIDQQLLPIVDSLKQDGDSDNGDDSNDDMDIETTHQK